MRTFLLFAPTFPVLGCVDRLAQRQSELAQWVGRPEIDLVGLMGAPTRTYEAGGTKFLTRSFGSREARLKNSPGDICFRVGISL